VRSLAREDLLSDAELVELRQRHARYFTARAEPPSVTASDPATAGWVRRVASELAEYRDIFAAARQPSRDRTSGLRLATHLGRVWEWTGQAEEGIATLCSLLDRTDGVHPTLVSEAESWIAYFAWRLGDMPTAESAVRNALNVLATDGDVGQRAAALGMASLVARGSGKPDLAEQYALDSEELWARLGDSWALARTRVLAGRAALAGGRLAEAEEHLDLARDQYTRLGPGRGSGWVATGLGMIRSEQGQFEEAVALGREALVEARRMDDRDTELEALDLLAAAESSLGREDDASRTRRAARELRQAIDHRRLTDEGVSESRS
jgi:tetratricopeptide (TPR) repeat protein